MNYRKYIPETDYEKVYKLCKEYSIRFPSDNSLLFVAEDEYGEIVGISGLKTVYQAEPLISRNPVAAVNLWHMIEGAALAGGVTEIMSLVDKQNTRHIGNLEKTGFELAEDDKLIFKKRYQYG